MSINLRQNYDKHLILQVVDVEIRMGEGTVRYRVPMDSEYKLIALLIYLNNVAINIYMDNKIDLIICIAQAHVKSRIQQFITVKPFLSCPMRS